MGGGVLGRANSLAKACAWSTGLARAWDQVGTGRGQAGGGRGLRCPQEAGRLHWKRVSGSEETRRDLYLGRVEPAVERDSWGGRGARVGGRLWSVSRPDGPHLGRARHREVGWI